MSWVWSPQKRVTYLGGHGLGEAAICIYLYIHVNIYIYIHMYFAINISYFIMTSAIPYIAIHIALVTNDVKTRAQDQVLTFFKSCFRFAVFFVFP